MGTLFLSFMARTFELVTFFELIERLYVMKMNYVT